MAARRSPTKAFLWRLRRRPGHALALGLALAGVGWLFWPRARPARTLNGTTVVIDPGHGGSDPGAVCAGVVEATLTYRTSATLARLLEERGARVVFTVRSASLTESGSLVRPRDAAPELAPGRTLQAGTANPEDVYIRADLAAREWERRTGPVLFLAIHYDASTSSGVRGSHALFDNRGEPPSRLARNISRRIALAGLSGTFPATPVRQKLGVLWAARNPVPERTLVECATLSDPEGRADAQNPLWREAFCRLLVAAVEETAKEPNYPRPQ